MKYVSDWNPNIQIKAVFWLILRILQSTNTFFLEKACIDFLSGLEDDSFYQKTHNPRVPEQKYYERV